MAAFRSAGFIPTFALPTIAAKANFLMAVSMAALGLGVDICAIAHAGPRLIAAVTLSGRPPAISFGVIRFLRIGAIELS